MAAFPSNSTGRDRSAWLVFLLLLAILVPSAGVIWMMRQAMESERLAVRQRLQDVYQSQLEAGRQRVNQGWQQRLETIYEQVTGNPAAISFAQVATNDLADGLVVWSADGKLLFPDRLERNPQANAELQQLERLDSDSPEWLAVADQLKRRLSRYDGQRLSAPQRLFLMRELMDKWPDTFQFVTWQAESLTAEYLVAIDSLPPQQGISRTPIMDVWSVHSTEQGVTALFSTPTLQELAAGFLAEQPLPKGLSIRPLLPDESLDNSAEQTVSLAPAMPDWHLGIFVDESLSIGGQQERLAMFAWMALAVLAATLFLTWLVVRSWWEQMRVARLKNDLVATVSHELKTPLSSIRLLVDTLLDEDGDLHSTSAIHGQAREYLELISHENMRLSRLIDNFLSFSRMERGKRLVNMQPLDARDVVAQAAEAVQERFNASNNGSGHVATLVVEANEAAPVKGDIDMLITAVVNLLDNAWKYSGDLKSVRLSCRCEDNSVKIDVQDNGIGLPVAAQRKVFDRFYQVDQSLSRRQGGCGLGLSIVKYVVEAHGGNVSVASQAENGSTFTISLPMDRDFVTESQVR